MPTLVILTCGLSIVILGILRFRLHAFLALVLAALFVAAATSPAVIVRSQALAAALPVAVGEPEQSFFVPADSTAVKSDAPRDWVLVRDQGRETSLTKVADLILERRAAKRGASLTPVEADPSEELSERPVFLIAPGGEPDDSADIAEQRKAGDRLLLIPADTFQAAVRKSQAPFLDRVTSEIGGFCAKLAILIVAASVIGSCLLESGAADAVVRQALRRTGERGAPLAFSVSGFVLSIPVFFDTVFYLMIPLGKALHLRTGRNYLLYCLSIVTGGTMAHSLVPPTPGPLFIVDELGVDMGQMILGGCIVGLWSAVFGLMYAYWINRRFTLPLRDIPESLRSPDENAASSEDHSVAGEAASRRLAMAALVPILLPVLLITLRTSADFSENGAELPIPFTDQGFMLGERAAEFLKTASDKNIALLTAAVISMVIYLRSRKPTRDDFSATLSKAVTAAGPIILVTAAGGSFGRMMQQTSIAEWLNGLPATSPTVVVCAAFAVTTAVRTAQGSATVAMITAAGVFGAIVRSGEIPVHPLYVALAIGCGSKPFSWMNDSGFFVITRMSGMTEAEGLKYVTPMTALAAFAGLGLIIAGTIWLPMI